MESQKLIKSFERDNVIKRSDLMLSERIAFLLVMFGLF